MSELRSWAVRADGWAIVVHGGAGALPVGRGDAHAEGCRRAVHAARRALEGGASAVVAACEAVVVLEDDPLYNAGTGAALDERGKLSLDASVMCGLDLRAGAVCALPPFRNPIAVARAVLEEGRAVLLAGEGAAAWAVRHGFAPADPASMITASACARLEEVRGGRDAAVWSGGTVGCVVRDRSGHLAAATSTGGMVGKPWGRVGDSPILGAGTYAEDAAGAVSNTGDGEALLRVVAAKSAVEYMRAGATAEEAVVMVLRSVADRLHATGGSIAIDALGYVAWARTTRSMAWAALGEDWADALSGF